MSTISTATRLPGILTLDTTTSTTNFNISNAITKQILLLQGVRVEFDTAAHALAAGVIYVDLPVYSSRLLIDGNPGHTYLPILLDNAVVTIQQTLQLPIAMAHDLHPNVQMRILDSTFNSAPTGLARLTLSFTYSDQFV